MVKRFWDGLIRLFIPQDNTDKFLHTMEEMLKTQQKQTELFQTWLMGFRQTGPDPAKTDATLDHIEDLARDGNPLAQELITDERLLKEYIESIKY